MRMMIGQLTILRSALADRFLTLRIALLVEQSAPYALLIANAEFTSFHREDPTMVEVQSTNKGAVRIANSAFWGPCNQVAKIAGDGTVAFSDCTFVQWEKKETAPRFKRHRDRCSSAGVSSSRTSATSRSEKKCAAPWFPAICSTARQGLRTCQKTTYKSG